MIVDLLRNDISLISEVGTLDVPELFRIETFATVHQMVSRCAPSSCPTSPSARSSPRCSPAARSPARQRSARWRSCASWRAAPRDVYCGAIGWIAPGGPMRFYVAIRTISLFPDGEAVYNVGGGVVFNSTAEEEYQECLLKARFATGRRRLRADRDAALGAGRRVSCGSTGICRGSTPRRRRSALAVILSMIGSAALSAAVGGAPAADAARAVATATSRRRPSPLSRCPPTRSGRCASRATRLDCRRSAAPPQDDAAAGLRRRARRIFREADEVMLLNERGEVCEGTITNIFVDIGDGDAGHAGARLRPAAGRAAREMIDAGEGARSGADARGRPARGEGALCRQFAARIDTGEAGPAIDLNSQTPAYIVFTCVR